MLLIVNQYYMKIFKILILHIKFSFKILLLGLIFSFSFLFKSERTT